jgi:hypothetical protein
MRAPRPAAAVLALLLAACALPATPPAPPPAGPLASSLTVRTGGGGAHLLLQVTNASDAAVELTFPDGRDHEFVIRRGERELWRSTDGRMYTQAVRLVLLAPGETLDFEEHWASPPGTEGAFEAEARLSSSSHPLRHTAPFRLP